MWERHLRKYDRLVTQLTASCWCLTLITTELEVVALLIEYSQERLVSVMLYPTMEEHSICHNIWFHGIGNQYGTDRNDYNIDENYCKEGLILLVVVSSVKNLR